MIRVLQVVNNMHRAGLETVLMNYYRHIDREKVQFDFLCHRDERSHYDDEIESMGGKLYRAPRLYPQNFHAYAKYMQQFFAEHPEYRIVHSHIDTMSYLPLRAAQKAHIPYRIAHSHNTDIDKDFKYPLKRLFKGLLPKVSTIHYACGEKAGKFLFPNGDFTVMNNAVEIENYAFNKQNRISLRKEHHVEDKFVIGHIGRFSYQKNHQFLLDAFAALCETRKDAVLWLFGEGEYMDEITKKIEECGLSSRVTLFGNRSDVALFYSAMDLFVLPSRFEGFPMVGVEAQISGLPCFFSDKVSAEADFTRNCAFIPLQTDIWAQQMASCLVRENREAVHVAKYDIKCQAVELQNFYMNLED